MKERVERARRVALGRRSYPGQNVDGEGQEIMKTRRVCGTHPAEGITRKGRTRRSRYFDVAWHGSSESCELPPRRSVARDGHRSFLPCYQESNPGAIPTSSMFRDCRGTNVRRTHFIVSNKVILRWFSHISAASRVSELGGIAIGFKPLLVYTRNDSFHFSCVDKKEKKKKECTVCVRACVCVCAYTYACLFFSACVNGGACVLRILYTNLAATYSGPKIARF